MRKPPTRGRSEVDLDAPESARVHGELIRTKDFLRRFYRDAYEFFRRESAALPSGARLELGSGGGFLQEVVPAARTSDIRKLHDVDVCCSATAIPFRDRSTAALILFNVLHHVPDVGEFFAEAERVLVPGGRILLIEPANTPLSRIVYRFLHHEPWVPRASDWRLPSGGPMSMANGALPWIVFVRDRSEFERRFPSLRIASAVCFSPLLYLLSGGLSVRQLLPSASLSTVVGLENASKPLHPWLGMFMRVVVEKRESGREA